MINLYRPAWDDFCVTTVYGSDAAQQQLLGQVRDLADWQRLLVDRFAQRGAYVVRAGEFDWASSTTTRVTSPRSRPATAAMRGNPEDALFVPMRHTDGSPARNPLGRRADQRRRPTDEDLDVLVALADHAAHAVQSAQEAAEAARHRLALEQLLRVSSRLTGEPLPTRSCARSARVSATRSASRTCSPFSRDRARPARPARRRWPERRARSSAPVPLSLRDVEGCFDPAVRDRGLLPPAARGGAIAGCSQYSARVLFELNGRGPWAWNHHWLLVPLHDSRRRGDRDAPGRRARGPPTAVAREAPGAAGLREPGSAAIVPPAHLRELRFLADHDPLTRLLNRRAFVDRLGERGRARDSATAASSGLSLCDLDGFKELNDEHGHIAGDEALQAFARTLESALRRPDDAFRIGGDEFALLLAEASEEHAREVVQRIVELLRASADTRLAGLGASFGAAAYPGEARRRRRTAATGRRSALPWPSATAAVLRFVPESGAVNAYASTIQPVQKYVLSELDSGERVISEKVPSVRSVSLGFWIGAGSRDERDDRAGRLALHRAPPLQGLALVRRAADRGDVRRDGRGAERRHLARAHGRLRARTRPPRRDGARRDGRHGASRRSFADLDQEREVVLEEIAMVRGHAAGARARPASRRPCSARHALGRPVIGTAEVISTVSRRAIAAYHRTMYADGEHRRRRSRQHRPRPARRPARAVRPPSAATARAGDARARRPLVRAPPPGPALPAQGHRAVPRVPRRAGDLALRPRAASPPRSSMRSSAARRRRGCSRRSARSAGWPTPSTASASQYTDTGLLGVYVGTREENLAACVEICVEQIAEHRARASLRPGELERAKESLKGRIDALDGVDLEPDEPARQVAHLRHRAPLARRGSSPRSTPSTADAVAELAAVLCRRSASRPPGIGPDEDRFLAARRAGRPDSRRDARRHEGRLRRRRGKVGTAVVPLLERAGHEVRAIELGEPLGRRRARRGRRLHDAGGGAAERARRARAGRLVRRRHDRLGSAAARRAGGREAGCGSSSRRTSRSAPC